MFTRRGARTTICLLLAVSTAVGAVVPARACECPTLPPKSPPPTNAPAATTPALKACCETSSRKRCGCSEAPVGVAKASCCDTKSRPDRPDPAGPNCVRCDCAAPGVPPAPAPVPSAPDADQQPAAAAVPPVLIPGPPAALSPAARMGPPLPRTDLVISLSRLTC